MDQSGETGSHAWSDIQIRQVRGPVRLELYAVLGPRRRIYIGDVQSIAEAYEYVRRRLPDREYRLVLRIGPAQRIAWLVSLRPSFGHAPQARTLVCATHLFEWGGGA